MFVFLVVMTLFAIVFERKVVGRMQNRIGPNRVGPWGTLQSLADGVKLAFKEEVIPLLADKPVYFLAPILSAVPAFLAFSVIPFGPSVSMFGHQTALQLTDLPVGVLVVFACSSLGVYGIVLSGWASGSTYPLLGGLRSAAQMISYEVAMGLSMVAVFMFAGTMSTSGIVASQEHHLERHPAVRLVRDLRDRGRRRDQPRAVRPARGRVRTRRRLPHRVLVAQVRAVLPGRVHQHGHRLARSRRRCSSAAGGHRGRSRCGTARTRAGGRCCGSSPRSSLAIFVFVWLRGTLPRLRYDQFMHLGWKVLLPINLVWILAVTTIHVLRDRGWPAWESTALPLGVVILLVVLPALVIWEGVTAQPAPPTARPRTRRSPPRRRPSRSRRWTWSCRRRRGGWSRAAAVSAPG